VVSPRTTIRIANTQHLIHAQLRRATILPANGFIMLFNVSTWTNASRHMLSTTVLYCVPLTSSACGMRFFYQQAREPLYTNNHMVLIVAKYLCFAIF